MSFPGQHRPRGATGEQRSGLRIAGQESAGMYAWEDSAPEKNKLLEVDQGQPGGRMDTRAAQAAERSNQAVETVDTFHRAEKLIR